MEGTQGRRNWLYVLTVLMLGAIILANFVWNGRPATAKRAQSATFELVEHGKARAGTLISLDLVASNVHDLAGYQATVAFDPAQVRLVGASVADDIKRSGRDFLQLGPVERAGAVVLGAASCPAAKCSDARPGKANRVTRGVDGRVTLGTVRFYAATPGQYTLSLDDVRLVDPQGQFMAVTTSPMVLNVVE